MLVPAVTVSSLRTHLLASLQSLPGSRIFHLHVLVTSPRKPAQSLFLHSHTRPKCLVQDVLVLLSEQTVILSETDSSSIIPDRFVSIKTTPRNFVSAIEASVYAFSASDSTILYISKVDGTGQGLHPSPTSTLLRAFLAFYASPQSPLYTSPAETRHLWIHLFARSQRQYLFPNSADHSDKKPLGDVALCKWWKRMLSDVAEDVEAKYVVGIERGTLTVEAPTHSIHLHYVLPGQTESEASYLLRGAQTSGAQQVQWIYSHPYDHRPDTGIPFPSAPSTSLRDMQEHPPLASLIPHFEDDPKSRFLDELAATSEEQAVAVPVPTPRRKRQKVGEGHEENNSTLGNGETHSSGENKERDMGGGELEIPARENEAEGQVSQSLPTIMYNPPSSSPPFTGTHSPPPRPSTPEPLQSQGTALLSPHTPSLPTFPTSLLSPHTPTPNQRGAGDTLLSSQTSTSNSSLPRTPRRPKSDLDALSAAEFWERMSFRQECALGAVTGFFVAIFSQRAYQASPHRHVANSLPSPNPSFPESGAIPITDIPPTLVSTGTIPHSVLKRVMSSLLTGVEFSTSERAHKGTSVIESAIKGLCEGLGQDNGSNLNPMTNNSATKKADAAHDQSSDVYSSHVYASLSISNTPLARKSTDSTRGAAVTPVNVLGVRRKKKRE